mmetsp:Transcript_17663/g.48784  ORF Transcript_17663/g.48784 Transcript_17663/m.48784 type:complete len:256 (-) Transcript_17663:814-1581(-)
MAALARRALEVVIMEPVTMARGSTSTSAAPLTGLTSRPLPAMMGRVSLAMVRPPETKHLRQMRTARVTNTPQSQATTRLSPAMARPKAPPVQPPAALTLSMCPCTFPPFPRPTPRAPPLTCQQRARPPRGRCSSWLATPRVAASTQNTRQQPHCCQCGLHRRMSPACPQRRLLPRSRRGGSSAHRSHRGGLALRRVPTLQWLHLRGSPHPRVQLGTPSSGRRGLHPPPPAACRHRRGEVPCQRSLRDSPQANPRQ